MLRISVSVFIISAAFIACAKNPMSGRSQMKLLPESELQSMATTQYQQFLSQNKVVGGFSNRDAEMVNRVGQRITRAVEDYYASKGWSNKLKGYQWEYKLVDSKDVNAWCMPGGKIVVYTGLLPITQNEAALAVVMGHEVTHAIFGHGNERMSQGVLQLGGQLALSVALANKPQETQNLFLGAYGVGTSLGVLLPFSRTHEYEADHYGLYWAALAGYNPNEAIPLWQRMEQASKGQKPPEFLSTHPSEGNRIEKLQQYMPEALSLYKPIGN
ncbi:MAG: M48 family metallopeptidase [Chitinophagaceae bacterium]|nr:M48 family metallopeptidase [Chitinophagaceae bacterium]MBL0334302.1 M48 family metallopeptidase [Chitinophagaceae bacterium]